MWHFAPSRPAGRRFAPDGLIRAVTTLAQSTTERQVLRWTFVRNGQQLTCELALSADEVVYELRVRTPDPAGATFERFVNVADAIVRQGEREKALIAEGWSLRNYERLGADRAI